MSKTHARGRTGGGRGTNQYQVQGASTRDAERAAAGNAERFTVVVTDLRDLDPKAGVSVARDESTTVRELAQLAGHRNKDVRIAVARNPLAGPDTLHVLACDRSSVVRYHVAQHAGTRTRTLQLLATEDRDSSVRLTARFALARRDRHATSA